MRSPSIDPDNPPDLTAAEVAKIMRVTKSTLARYRDKHIGPPWTRTPGGHYRYPVAGLKQFAADQQPGTDTPSTLTPILNWETVGRLRWYPAGVDDDNPEHGGPHEPDPDEYDPSLDYPDALDDTPDQTGT